MRVGTVLGGPASLFSNLVTNKVVFLDFAVSHVFMTILFLNTL